MNFKNYIKEEENELKNGILAEMSNIGPRIHKFGIDVKIHIHYNTELRKLKHGPQWC